MQTKYEKGFACTILKYITAVKSVKNNNYSTIMFFIKQEIRKTKIIIFYLSGFFVLHDR